MKKIIRILPLLLAILLISSCGMFRKVFKSKEYSKIETTSKITKDSAGIRSDKSVTTTTEIIDTTVATPEKIVKQDVYLNMDSLINGLTAVKNDLLDVKLVFNPVTGLLTTTATIKPQKVPVLLNRQTVKQNDITEQSQTKNSREDKSKSIVDNSKIEKTPDLTWGYVVLGVLIAIAILFFVFNRRT